MYKFEGWENFKNCFNILTDLGPSELVFAIMEILIISFAIYRVLKWMKNTRAWLLLRGVVIIGSVLLLSYLLHFDVIIYTIQKLTLPALIALIIIFQDDIRS